MGIKRIKEPIEEPNKSFCLYCHSKFVYLLSKVHKELKERMALKNY